MPEKPDWENYMKYLASQNLNVNVGGGGQYRNFSDEKAIQIFFRI